MSLVSVWLDTGVVCRVFSTTVKEHFKYDDSLDVFGVHGVGGFLGTCVLGIFGHTFFGGFNEVSFRPPVMRVV
jgi:Amt family ammonium transporter